MLNKNSDMYLTEFVEEFAFHPMAIHYALKAMDTQKKNCIYGEQDFEKTKDYLEIWFHTHVLKS